LSPKNFNEHGGHISILVDKADEVKLLNAFDKYAITCDKRPFDG